MVKIQSIIPRFSGLRALETKIWPCQKCNMISTGKISWCMVTPWRLIYWWLPLYFECYKPMSVFAAPNNIYLEINHYTCELFPRLSFLAAVITQGTLLPQQLYTFVPPVQVACGFEECVSILIEARADPTFRWENSHCKIHAQYHVCCGASSSSLLYYAIATALSPRTRDSHGRTPVHFAASCGHVAILEQLLQNGGGSSTPDKHGYTPVHWAAYNGTQ